MPKKQPDLFGDIDEYPHGQFKPVHPLFRGTALVAQHRVNVGDSEPYKVNLDTGECSCKHGAAWVWYSDRNTDGKYIKNMYCVHKLKAMADKLEASDRRDDPETMFAFIKAVATRYNVYEVTSAFHKELRRGAVDRAYFFGCILAASRGTKGVLNYLNNIVYEETRDHAFAEWITEKLHDRASHNFLVMSQAITWFCETKKKWDLHETRLPIFLDEMRGYQNLVKEFGNDVAKASHIIDSEYAPIFLKNLTKAIASKDRVSAQYNLKGLQKTTPPNGAKLEDLRAQMLEAITAGFKLRKGIVPASRRKTFERFRKRLRTKYEQTGSLSYHDLNAFCDYATGEPYAYGVLPEARRATILAAKKPLLFPFDRFPTVPLYAHDNHTWRGKALIRHYPHEAQPHAEQTQMDLRGCGAYLGVAWRYLAMSQHGTIKISWHDVKFPSWLVRHLNNMWY